VFLAKLQSDLREFIVLLNSHKVEFVVVGGHAVAFHGHPRYTGDIDFFVRTTPENAERVLRVLDDFGFGNLGIRSRTYFSKAKSFSWGDLRIGSTS
jgi:hypothetical protein